MSDLNQIWADEMNGKVAPGSYRKAFEAKYGRQPLASEYDISQLESLCDQLKQAQKENAELRNQTDRCPICGNRLDDLENWHRLNCPFHDLKSRLNAALELLSRASQIVRAYSSGTDIKIWTKDKEFCLKWLEDYEKATTPAAD